MRTSTLLLLIPAAAAFHGAGVSRHPRRLARLAAAADAAPADDDRPHVVVVGAGWAGFGAAEAAAGNGCRVTLLDALPDPTGATPYLSATGKPVEAGVRGFWRDYPNIEACMARTGVDVKDALTDYLPSAFFSPDGLEATAPVFADARPLPSPLGQVLATFDNFKRLPLSDRATMAGLLVAILDLSKDDATFEKYDRMSAGDLFNRCGLSKRLVDDFIRPTLLVGLFKPPEELSAAVAMELLYYYALAHQDSFDVRWMRNGTIAEAIINPLAAALAASGSVEVRGSSFVEEVHVGEGGGVEAVTFRSRGADASETVRDVDAVVLALGPKGWRSVVQGSPGLSGKPFFSKASSLGAVDCISVRLWLDATVATRCPANVLSKFDGLAGAGGTFFMLDQLQADPAALWGSDAPQGSVVACDFYNSAALATRTDEGLVSLLLDELLPEAEPGFKGAVAVDSWVQRYPGAATWFSPGSNTLRPTTATPVPNLVACGDWVRMGADEHGAKGLCQERAYVSGIVAANRLARDGRLGTNHRKEMAVIPVRDDEPQVVAGIDALRRVKGALGPFAALLP